MKIFLSILTVIVIAAGVVGIVVPGLPAAPLILLGSVLYGFGYGFERIGLTIYIILTALALLSLVIDYLGSMFGARKFGASKWGIFGAILGLFVGFLIGNIWGLLIGPFLGAFLLELLLKRKAKQSLKAGLGAVLGFLGGFFLRFPICLAMIVLIIWGIVK